MNINEQRFQFDSDGVREELKKGTFKLLKFSGVIVTLLIILIVIANSIYIVRQDEVATIREFGEIKKIVVSDENIWAEEQNSLDSRFKDVRIDHSKGLKLKVPFITTVDRDTEKLLTYISNTAKINTRDKIKYEINMYAQWKITHPGIFRSSLGNVTRANSKIDEVAYAVVIDRINRLSSSEFLYNKDVVREVLDKVAVDLNVNLATQGIQIIDIEVYRTVVPASNIDSTYKKMIAEREAIAQQIRSEGLEIYNNTVSDVDRQVAEIKADAIEKSQKIIGEADAEALSIYANSFSKDPEFYKFWRTLKSYEKTIDEKSVLFIDQNNEYLKTFSNGQ